MLLVLGVSSSKSFTELSNSRDFYHRMNNLVLKTAMVIYCVCYCMYTFHSYPTSLLLHSEETKLSGDDLCWSPERRLPHLSSLTLTPGPFLKTPSFLLHFRPQGRMRVATSSGSEEHDWKPDPCLLTTSTSLWPRGCMVEFLPENEGVALSERSETF